MAVIVEKDAEDWLVSEVVELPLCHTQAKAMDELLKRTKEAIKGHEEAVNEPSTKFVGVQLIEA